MKKAIKKIAAVAMAFTLIGVGSLKTLKAYAGVPPQNCSHSSIYVRDNNIYCSACGTKLGAINLALTDAKLRAAVEAYLTMKLYEYFSF